MDPLFDVYLRQVVEHMAGECQEYRAMPVITLALAQHPHMLYCIMSPETPLPLLERVLREALETVGRWREAKGHTEEI